MSDSAKMKCGHCQKVIKFPVDKVGKTAKCPGCSHTIKLVDQTTKPPARPLARPAATATTQPPPLKPVQGTLVPAEPPPQPVPAHRNADALVDNLPIEAVQDSRLSKFVTDGQPPKVIAKLLGRIDQVCTDDESPEYAAVQHLPGVMSPDAIVLTNRRVIIFRSKAFGRMNMIDVQWMDVHDIHIKEGIVGAGISVRGNNGHTEVIDHLPKKQARCVYRVGQQREEEMREFRRTRKMEEDRNAAGGVTVNAAIGTPAPATADPMAKLQQLKAMLDGGLIEQAEFDAKKAEILSQM